MKAKKTVKKTAKTKEEEPQKKARVVVRARVVRNGVSINGSTCAAGVICRLYDDVAEYHEGRDEVEILGS